MAASVRRTTLTNSIDSQIVLLITTALERMVALVAGMLLMRGGLKVLVLESSGKWLATRTWPDSKWFGTALGVGMIVGGAALTVAAGSRLLT